MAKLEIVYETSGRAREYCQLAANLYRGCTHGCVYCYAPAATRSDRIAFHETAQPRNGIAEKIARDAANMWGLESRPVLLSFISDAYQPDEARLGIARSAIEALKAYGHRIMILTKGGRLPERDFDLLGPDDQMGATLTTLDDQESLKWEPGAAMPSDRIACLEKAKARGIKTWASLEPVIDPPVSLEIIRRTHTFVDHYKVGKMNYHPISQTVDWHRFGHAAQDLLESLECSYYLKKDLVAHM